MTFALTTEGKARIERAKEFLLQAPQIDLQTEHILHAGIYARTIRMEADTWLMGALIKIPTLLFVTGHTSVYTGEQWIELKGPQVIPASAGRQQIFVAHAPTVITMTFPTQAKSVEEAEREFTDDYDLLVSHRSHSDIVTITGE